MINYKITGVGPPIIICHGLFGMLDNWRTMAAMLEHHFQVILVDMRNHGKSFWSDDFNYPILAADVIEVLDHLEISRTHIIGHSMGGKVAMTIAGEYPDRISKLVVIDIASKKYAPGHESIFEAILSLDLNEISTRSEIDSHLKGSIKDQVVRQFLMKGLRRNEHKNLVWKTNYRSLYENYNNILSEIPINCITAPTLFIRGILSNYILDEDIDYLRAKIKNARFCELNAGHWIHAERSQEMFEVLLDFLSTP